jgi:hypothetical protein
MHKREEYLNETFTGPDMQSHLEYCASQYPTILLQDLLVLAVSNLLLLAGIVIDVVAVLLIIRYW